MIILLPILFPLVTGLGFDPVWFGIIMVVWLEIGLHHAAGRHQPLRDPGHDARAAACATSRSAPRPIVVLMILLVVLLFAVPGSALWLPRQMMAGPR